MMKISWNILCIFFQLMLISCSASNPLLVQDSYYLRVYLKRGNINGVEISLDNPEIRVDKGGKVSGFLEVIVDNNRGGPWITPVIGVNSWDRNFYQPITNDAPTGKSTQRFTFDFVVPVKNGTYYVAIFAGWWYSCEELASNDHPPKFGDGDDVWDMPKTSWENIIAQGQGGWPYYQVGRAVRIIVGSGAEDTSVKQPEWWIWILVCSVIIAGVSGFITLKRKQQIFKSNALSDVEEKVLQYLKDNNFKVSISKMATELKLTEHAVRETLNSLKEKGLIEF